MFFVLWEQTHKNFNSALRNILKNVIGNNFGERKTHTPLFHNPGNHICTGFKFLIGRMFCLSEISNIDFVINKKGNLINGEKNTY